MNERIKELIEQAGLSALLGNNWLYGEELEEFAELVRQDYLRELRALKPVAWMLPKYGDVLSAAECQGGGGIYNVPLYALDEPLAPPEQKRCECIDQFWCATFDRCKRNE